MSNSSIWLIRTKQNKILGPVSKQKVVELLDKGSLTGEDELCSGNGYWFWVKEQDLIAKYLKSDITQDFNPISEAQTLYALTNSNIQIEKPKAKNISVQINDEEEILVPDQEDLEYPNPDDFKNLKFDETKLDRSITDTPVVKTEFKLVETDEDEEIHFPKSDDLDYPEMDSAPVVENTGELINLLEEEKTNPPPKKKNVLIQKSATEAPKVIKKKRVKKVKNVDAEKIEVKKMKKENNTIFLYIIGLILSILLYAVYFYYTNILGKALVQNLDLLIQTTHAQQIAVEEKKN